MAANLTAAELAEKQIRNLTNNVDSWQQGVQRTTKKPMQLAKAAIPKMKANFNRAIDDGTVAQGFDSVSDADWKQTTIDKGKDRIGPGVEQARSTIENFQQQRMDYIKRTQGEIDSLPDITDADGEKRMLKNLQRMRKFSFVKRPK